MRRDLALSLSFSAAVNLGLLLTVLTGVGSALDDKQVGRWLESIVTLGAALWSPVLFVAIGEAVSVGDPVARIEARRSRLLRATRAVLHGELIRNAGTSLLQRELEAAGGSLSLLILGRSQAAESFVRSRHEGQLADVNVPRLLAAVRAASGGGSPRVWLQLGETMTMDTVIAEKPDGDFGSSARSIQRSLAVQPPRVTGDIRAEIESLRVEATMSIGPDKTALEAVLAAYDAVLEGYARGWRICSGPHAGTHLRFPVRLWRPRGCDPIGDL
jgi:hypothetical protein